MKPQNLTLFTIEGLRIKIKNGNKTLSVYSEKTEFKFRYIHTFEKAILTVRNKSNQVPTRDVWYKLIL